MMLQHKLAFVHTGTHGEPHTHKHARRERTKNGVDRLKPSIENGTKNGYRYLEGKKDEHCIENRVDSFPGRLGGVDLV